MRLLFFLLFLSSVFFSLTAQENNRFALPSNEGEKQSKVLNELQQKYFHEKDSLYTKNHGLLKDYFYLYYEQEAQKKIIAQQQNEIKTRSRSMLCLTVLVFLLILALCYNWINLLKIKKKNRLLFDKINELSQTKAELMEFKITVQNKYFSGDKEIQDPGYDLFDRLEDFMKKEKPFIFSDYGRKNLIADMNTNEVYLAKSIRNAKDMTILDYIYHWRLEYAKILLLEDLDLTVEAVSLDSGFTSLRNFYRLFKEAYGVTPANFRTYVKES